MITKYKFFWHKNMTRLQPLKQEELYTNKIVQEKNLRK